MRNRTQLLVAVLAGMWAWQGSAMAQDAGSAEQANRAQRASIPDLDAWPKASPGDVSFDVPPVRDRALSADAGPRTSVLGFRVAGVAARPELGITPEAVQALVDGAYQARVSGEAADPALAQFGSEVYEQFAGVASGATAPQADISLARLMKGRDVSGPGRAPELYGLNADELAHVDGLLMQVIERRKAGRKAASVSIAQAVALLRQSRFEFTVGQMQAIASQVTNFYRAQGLFLARAFVPAQTVGEDAVVEIQVLEGALGRVVVEGNDQYSASTLSRVAAQLSGQAVTKDSVEAALLRTNDMPGVRVFGTFRPGTGVGESDLVLQVTQEKRADFEVGVDNYGTEFTGEVRGRAEVNWNNPIGQADRLNFSVVQSISPANNLFGRLGYRLPLGATNLTAGLSASVNEFDLNDGNFEIFQITGDTTILQADLDWSATRSRFFNSRFGGAISLASSQLADARNSSLQINDDDISKLALRWDMDHVDARFNGINVVNATLETGEREFINAFGDGTQRTTSDFSLLGLTYSRLQALPISHTILLRLRGQFSGDRLSSLEQFSLSGPDSVRAYPVSTILTDEGLFASFEYRIPGPAKDGPFGSSWKDLLRFDLFLDYASGSNNDDEISQGFSENLAGAGVGARFSLAGKFAAGLQLSGPLSKFPNPNSQRTRTENDSQGNPVTVTEDAAFAEDLNLYADFSFYF